MKYMTIYDNTGVIISQQSFFDGINKPVGVPWATVVIPAKKRLKAMDISKEPHEPIFEDIPNTKFEELEIKLDNQENTIANLAYMLMEQGGE